MAAAGPLHAYFLTKLLEATAFLIPFIVVHRLKSRAKCPSEYKALHITATGFLVGFTFYLIGGAAAAYIYKLPILPLILREMGYTAQQAVQIYIIYNVVFTAVFLSILYASLLIAAYGIHKLLTERC